jgi:hypothetical protein
VGKIDYMPITDKDKVTLNVREKTFLRKIKGTFSQGKVSFWNKTEPRTEFYITPGYGSRY